ncbi:PEBP-like protein [Backusella circina FSU 941]|nr:PEBP-like protein [Backusella circina FSU 941]
MSTETTFNLKSFIDSGLVPDYVPQAFETSSSLDVEFPNAIKVNNGTLLSRAESKPTPKVTFTVEDHTSKYTLLCIDPDAPTRSWAVLGPVRHWTIIDIPGSSGDASAGKQIGGSYAPPGPPPFTGEHRYVFLLYKQTKADAHLESLLSRMRWDYKLYIKEHGLELVAANFFVAKF